MTRDLDASTTDPAEGTLPGERGERPVTAWDRLVAWSLLAALVATLVGIVGFGSRQVDGEELVRALKAGEVELLEVEGQADGWTEDEGVVGTWPLELMWRDGVMNKHVELVRASPRLAQALESGDEDWVLGDEWGIDGDGSGTDEPERWQEQPVDFSSAAFAEYPMHVLITLAGGQLLWAEGDVPDAEIGDRLRVPVWASAVYGFAVLLAIGTLLARTPTQWMTRWAWFWVIVMVPVVGLLAHAVLGAHGAPGPRSRTSYRMPGLTGFALGVVVSVALGFLGRLL